MKTKTLKETIIELKNEGFKLKKIYIDTIIQGKRTQFTLNDTIVHNLEDTKIYCVTKSYSLEYAILYTY